MDEQKRLWSVFEKSGKAADYLAFCRERKRHSPKPGVEIPDGRKDEPQSSL